MSDTPRTDLETRSGYDCDGPVVRAEFAKTLERELAALRSREAEAEPVAGIIEDTKLAEVTFVSAVRMNSWKKDPRFVITPLYRLKQPVSAPEKPTTP